MINLKYTTTHELAHEPTKGSAGAACYDLYAASCTIGHYFTEYDIGIAVEIPEGHVGLIYPRSSVSNKGMWLCNSTGVIDSDFRGSLKVRFYRSHSEYYEIGERVAQLMIMPIPEVSLERVDQLSGTVRGDGGFGSTGSR